ncbi:MAG TPA: hypothetical protein VMY37_32950 [Thermoguttaceae bacterium]|nr:hypothetical protein [Thermoguttaceae bacterium]
MARLLPLAAALCLAALAPTADAALHVDVGDLALVPGETGYLDVTISSDSGDLLDIFGVEFRISTSGTTRLEFVDPPPDPQLADPAYIFFGDSLAEFFPPAGAVSTTSTANDTYIGGDGTILMLGHAVPSSPGAILAQLQVTSATGAPPLVGDTFAISVESTFSPISANGSTTFFLDPVFSELTYESDPGTVTMVPEPGMAVVFAVLGALGAVGLAVGRYRRGSALPPPA